MKHFLVVIIIFYLSSTVLFSQRQVSQIEGYLEVYIPEDLTSLYLGKNVARLVNGSTQRFNTYVGSEAGAGTITGLNNSFFGRQTGFFTTTGSRNSFFGRRAGYRNTTGFNNSFFGSRAGYNNTTGFRNSFFGYLAGFENSSGGYNSFFGRQAGYKNTTGFQNSFFGDLAGFENSSGIYNSFFGREAGHDNTTGRKNSFFGHLAGLNNTSGNNNSFFGELSGSKIVRGNSNVCIGSNAGPTLDLSNKLYIDIRESDFPLIYGEFDNDLVQINGTLRLGAMNHFSGSDDGLITSPTADGADLFLEANDAVIVEIGAVAASNGSFEVWEATTNNPLLILNESGNLIIEGTLSQGSDVNRKESILTISEHDILSKVKNLQIKEWQYIGEDIRHLGPMAQDFYKAFGLGQGETTISSVDADGVALAAIKALAEENQVLKTKYLQANKRLIFLEEEMKALRQLIQIAEK